MKKSHIFLIVLLAAGIAFLISYSSTLTTYDTIQSAHAKKGKYVHLITVLSKEHAIEYDPVKNPNYLVFYAKDTAGSFTKVVYQNVKPADLEKSTQLVLKGEMLDDYFNCREILLKCPSKYKEDREQLNERFQAHS